VLRFLAEDLGKHLDLVLDGILAGLVHRTWPVKTRSGTLEPAVHLAR